MKTIKIKLFLTFLLFMVSFIALYILLNIVFLEKYYIFANQNEFIKINATIKNEYWNNNTNMENILYNTERIYGIKINIANNEMKNLFDSSPKKIGAKNTLLPINITTLIKKGKDNLDAKYIYDISENSEYGNKNIIYISKLDEQHFLILQKSINAIVESSNIANRFFMYIGLFIILIGCIIVYLFSKKLTMPIIEMSNISKSMADLDFTKRIKTKSNDEIGTLGNNINKLSENLNLSINNLLDDAEKKKELIRNASHELKTPISVIKGYTEGLKFGIATDKDKFEKYCTIIVSECDRMNVMVNELLELSALENSNYLEISCFDIGDLIWNVSDKFMPIITEKDIIIDINCMQGIIISADYELIERAISNYLKNAINHINDKKTIKIVSCLYNNSVKITVFNTGRHISENDIKNIWEVFYKVDKARSREYGGFGLGLSIVKSIVDAHGGNCCVKNVENGVEFSITLPLNYNSKTVNHIN